MDEGGLMFILPTVSEKTYRLVSGSYTTFDSTLAGLPRIKGEYIPEVEKGYRISSVKGYGSLMESLLLSCARTVISARKKRRIPASGIKEGRADPALHLFLSEP
jgi:hypothetical protein